MKRIFAFQEILYIKLNYIMKCRDSSTNAKRKENLIVSSDYMRVCFPVSQFCNGNFYS